MSFTITQNNLGLQLLNTLLGTTTGVSNFKVKLTGDGRAFGTFQDDPFGLKSGVVLSTGKVTDLAGKNVSDGGFSPGINVPLTFTKLEGVTGSVREPRTAVYRTDLSKIGFDISSITIADSGSGVGGASGRFSGFDLDGIKFSRQLINSASEVNSLADLKDALDFSPAKTVLAPGTQRPGDFQAPDLFGTVNGNINNAVATLGEFDAFTNVSSPNGDVSLGDGGRVGFDLTNPLAKDSGSLYLYIGEGGDNDEEAAGQISVSNRPINGQNVLSTDFGVPGEANDTISMQIDFDADSTADKLFFQFVFGSEEFVEFGGQFNDAFSLELNGVNLAQLNDGSEVTINNLVPSPLSNYNPDFIYNAVGTGPASDKTGLDGYTKTLTFVGDLDKNAENTLTITVKDNRDGLLDSAVFLKAGTLGTVRPSQTADGGNSGGSRNNPSTTPSFKNGPNNVFSLEGGAQKLRFNLTGSNARFINEVGVFAVNDDQGTINGIRPKQPGYLQAALGQSQVVFSALSQGGLPNPSRTLNFGANDTRLVFYLVQNSTTDQALADLEAGRTPANVLFASNFGNNNVFSQVQVSNLGNNSFALNWEDELGGGDTDFDDLVMKVELTDAPLPRGTALQGKREGELFDLRNSPAIQTSFVVNSEAAYDNVVGFYTIDDETGRIGNLRPEDAGYTQAALQRSVLNLNRNATNATGQFNGGNLLAPYIIANGSLQEFLSQNPNNQSEQGPLAYFAFLGANPDKVDHIRLLGDNQFGFEDIYGGGDRDFNDVVIQVNFT